jgi:DUF1365 family protein
MRLAMRMIRPSDISRAIIELYTRSGLGVCSWGKDDKHRANACIFSLAVTLDKAEQALNHIYDMTEDPLILAEIKRFDKRTERSYQLRDEIKADIKKKGLRFWE